MASKLVCPKTMYRTQKWRMSAPISGWEGSLLTFIYQDLDCGSPCLCRCQPVHVESTSKHARGNAYLLPGCRKQPIHLASVGGHRMRIPFSGSFPKTRWTLSVSWRFARPLRQLVQLSARFSGRERKAKVWCYMRFQAWCRVII